MEFTAEQPFGGDFREGGVAILARQQTRSDQGAFTAREGNPDAHREVGRD